MSETRRPMGVRTPRLTVPRLVWAWWVSSAFGCTASAVRDADAGHDGGSTGGATVSSTGPGATNATGGVSGGASAGGDTDVTGDGGNTDGGSGRDSSRVLVDLDDLPWRFTRSDFAQAEPIGTDFDDASWQQVTIPHDWNGGIDGVNADVFSGPDMYLGAGWYRARFAVAPAHAGKRLALKFEAVASKADVWLNGVALGQHRGGYTAFEFDITDVVSVDGDNLLVVRASNANDPEIAPWMAVPFGTFPSASDYAPYGGMYRDVWLVVRDEVGITSHLHRTPTVGQDRGVMAFSTTVENAGAQGVDVRLLTEVLDATGTTVQSVESNARIEAGTTFDFDGETAIETPHLWSPEVPYLYTVRSDVFVDDERVDGVEQPLGFRWYTLQNGTGFVLNGEPSLLQGVNRHQDMQGKGYALSNEDHVRDVERIKNMGFNLIRHAHYPADPAFVRACDELGVMLWLEVPVSTAISPAPAFLDNAKSQLTEMIAQSYNHPSVIVWGIGNESDRIGDPQSEAPAAYSTEVLTQLHDLAKSLDPTRPTTGCNFENVENQGIVDVYAPQDWNGWYEGVYTDYLPTQLIGEYGSSIHLPDHDESFVSSSEVQPWTQEYGAEYHEFKASLGLARRNDFPGHLVWVAFDFASPRVDRASNPIPYMNQKGLYLHDHETKKDLAYFYESFQTDGADNPMVYIVSETWLDRITGPGPLTVWAYSNAETVELFAGTAANPKESSLGTTTRNAGPRGDTRFQWDDANIVGPVLTAEASIAGEVVATHSITFEGDW